MINGQNLFGFIFSVEKKVVLVVLLVCYNVMLIEDDVYSEFYFGCEKLLLVKFWDCQEMMLYCSLFLKCLVFGFCIGWVVVGKQVWWIQQFQLMSMFFISLLMQLVLVDYLFIKCYDVYLCCLCCQLVECKQQVWQVLLCYLLLEVIVYYSDSGYFLWIELLEGVDVSVFSVWVLVLYISIVSGKMFFIFDSWILFFCFNIVWGWGECEEQGVKCLGEFICEQFV